MSILANKYFIKLGGKRYKFEFSTGVIKNGSIIISDGENSITIPLTTSMNTSILVASNVSSFITQNGFGRWKIKYITNNNYFEIYSTYNDITFSVNISDCFTQGTTPINIILMDDYYSDDYLSFEERWPGLSLYFINNFDKEGKAKNISTQSWLNSDKEDVNIPNKVCFEQPDIDFTFIVKDSFNDIDVSSIHDDYIFTMRTGRVLIKSLYAMKEAEFICLSDYNPTLTHLRRTKGQNYILGTITMHRISSCVNIIS